MNCKACVYEIEDHEFDDLCACLEILEIDIDQFGTPDPLDENMLIFDEERMKEELSK